MESLRQILSITGRPGLYKIISQGNKTLIVEDLSSRKRMPISPRDKVVSLGDIAMYTEEGDLPLGEILDRVYAHYEGKGVDLKGFVAEGRLRGEFGEVITDFDRDRVYDNDIKKLFSWYNILVDAGFTKFADENADQENSEEADK